MAAGALGFLIFSHAFDGPDLYGALSFFETMPSIPNYESIAFRGKPLVDFRGGPLLVFLRRSLALDLSLFCLSLFGHVIAPWFHFRQYW